jgi:hypothetical protein
MFLVVNPETGGELKFQYDLLNEIIAPLIVKLVRTALVVLPQEERYPWRMIFPF